MKIVGIYGSMRENGNSDWMLNTLLNAAESEGADIERVFLRKYKDLRQCTGCDSCATTGKCCLTDDMQKIYPKLIEAKVIVVATPNYFKNVSGLTKLLIDRTNALLRKDRQLKKRFGVGLLVGGEELEDTQYCEDALKRFFKGHKIETLHMIKARADKKGQASQVKALETELIVVGKGIAKESREIMEAILTEHNP